MEFRLTSESMDLLIESIVDAVETTEDRDMQFEKVRQFLKIMELWRLKINTENNKADANKCVCLIY